MNDRFDQVLPTTGGLIASAPPSQLTDFGLAAFEMSQSVQAYNNWVTPSGIGQPGGSYVQVGKDTQVSVSIQNNFSGQSVTVNMSYGALRSQGAAAVVAAVNAAIKAGTLTPADKIRLKDVKDCSFNFMISRDTVYV
jgi:hypothetical protein